jgi:hypothetical protein
MPMSQLGRHPQTKGDRFGDLRGLRCALALAALLVCGRVSGATLSGSFTPVPQGSDVDLTAEGKVDWVHWGLLTETSVDRKAMVPPVIGRLTAVDAPKGSVFVYQYADNYNGYSWRDGSPVTSVTNTPTGVWAYGTPNIGTGFEVSVPADPAVKTVKVYVGTFAAKGRFTATLSDSSAPEYADDSLSNSANGPGGVYTIDFAADSPGQRLLLRWVLTQAFRPDGNVTLQAAALDAPASDNPPFVAITAPANSSAHPAGQTLTLTADAFDADGTVAKVEFFDGDTRLGDSTTGPYQFAWPDVPAGRHLLSAKATDDTGGSRFSAPVELFAHTAGGSLTGGVALPPATADLTAEGTLDWMHWGFRDADSANRKADAPPLIGNFVKIGTNAPVQFQETFTAYSWSDGTPVAKATDTRTGVYLRGASSGFTFSTPADTHPRTLKVYVSLYGARGLFQAYLGDFSAPVYADTSLDSVFGNDYAVFTLNFTAASAGQNLTVRYTTTRAYDELYGNLSLQAATLTGHTPDNLPPVVSITSPTNDSIFGVPANLTVNVAASDGDGTISRVEIFEGTNKLGEFTNAPYSLVWSNVAAGSYSLTASATDDRGSTAASDPVNITVEGAASSIILVEPVSGTNQFTFSFASQTNRTYIIERATSLSPSNWEPLTNRPGNGGTITVTEAMRPETNQFYRVHTQ